MKGKVFLVGSGPGDPELLTLKALRILRTADIVLHDDLVPPAILELAPEGTEVFSVGKRCGRKQISQKEINSLMVSYAREGYTVVRLKGGDPLIFGRAAEEIDALREAGVDWEIIPGVTAATCAAAAAGISLTDRRCSSKVILATGHRCAERLREGWPEADSSDATVVVYMPGENLRRLADELAGAGLEPSLPCLIVSQASMASTQIHATTLAELPQAPPLPSPKLVIAGAVAASWRGAPAGTEALASALVEA